MESSFGNWVKRRRKALDLTQQALAQQVGCSLATIVKIELDERRPSRQIAQLLAQALEIPSEQLPLFIKIARQEKSTDRLDAIPPHSGIEPAPASRPAASNLPVSPHELIGRRHELSVITRQLLEPSTCRLLTLTGPGGVGKTRTSIEAGRQLESHFSDGVYFISMAGIGTADSMIPGLADALGLIFSGPAEPIVQVSNFLRHKQMLLIIDNMEHLLDAGNLLAEILQRTERLRMLITSREPLRLQWEWIFEVQGLPVPEDADSNLEANSAISLFIQRARQTSHAFSLQEGDLNAIVQICKMVGGLPLAIELAASWVRVLSCREIAKELERGLDFLETQKADIPLRHRSIRAVFDHSWALLTRTEQSLLKQLSVFQGGFTREAALSITHASLPLLSSLVDKSLLRHSKTTNRYDLHELIRQYTYAELQSDALEEQQASEGHAMYFANWIAALDGLFKSAQQPQTSQLIREETSNWLAAIRWAVDHQRLDLLRKMAPCLNWYFEVHGFYSEALSTFKSALDKFRAAGAPASLGSAEERSAFAGLVNQAGWFEFRMGNIEQGERLIAESLEIARDYDDPEIMYYIYGNWGYLSLMRAESAEAGRLTAESLRYARLLDSPWHIAIPINVLGIVSYQQGNLTEARQQLTESLELWRKVGDPRGLVFCMLYLGMTLLALKDVSASRSVFEESNRIAEANMDRWALAFGFDMLGMTCMSQGNYQEAISHFTKAIALSKEIGDSLGSTESTVHLGQAYAGLQCNDDARQLFLDAYENARQAKWMPIILNVFVSFAEMQTTLPPETRLALVTSVLSHSAITPHVRARGEHVRAEMTASLAAQQVETADRLAKGKSLEDWAQIIIQ